MLHDRALALSLVTMLLAGGCGLAYQAASARRASKMETDLANGLTMSQVRQTYGEPDIEDKPDDHTEVWSYAKHANNNDLTAEVLYTSAKEGDTGTFEDLKFVDGKLASWSEAQHTMAAKERSEITTTIGYGRGGRHGSRGGTQPDATSAPDPDDTTGSGDSSGSNGRPNPLSVTF